MRPGFSSQTAMIAAVLGAALLAPLASPLPAQSPGAAPAALELGARVGVAISDLSLESDPTSSVTGPLAGISLTWRPGLRMFVAIEALYAGEGGSSTTEVEGDATEVRLDLTSVEVPIVAGAELPTAGLPVRPRVFAGASLRVPLRCRIESTGAGASDRRSCGESGIEAAGPDVGLLAGAGLAARAGSVVLSLDVRYHAGLGDAVRSGGTVSVGQARLRSWEVLAGAALPWIR